MTVYEGMSVPEQRVSSFLTELGLWWKYEYPVYVMDDKERPRLYAPDFYLPKLGVFIEVCGSKKFNYDYREEIYKKNDFQVIFIHYYKDEELWKRFLVDKIRDTHESRETFIENMIQTYDNPNMRDLATTTSL